MHSIVCDAGGLLVSCGAIEGKRVEDAEILALDWTSVTVARFLAARFEGDLTKTDLELGLALSVVDEWFPVRNLVSSSLGRSSFQAVDSLDSWSALLLAEKLDVSLFTASDEVKSDNVQIIRPW